MKIAFDLKQMRPGCAIVQASFGCEGTIAHLFDTKDWLLTPTPDMRVYPLEDWQVPFLVQKVEEHRCKNVRSSLHGENV